MNRPRVARLLRTAFCLACGIVCLLLCLMWVGLHVTRHSFQPVVGRGNNAALFGDGFGWVVRLGNNGLVVTILLPFKSRAAAIKMGRVVDRYGVGLQGGRGQMLLDIPYWFLILLTGGLAALGRMHWSPRFSLRAMLAATTLVAVLLGLFAFYKHYSVGAAF